MWIAAGNEDKKLLDIWSSVIVNYNSNEGSLRLIDRN